MHCALSGNKRSFCYCLTVQVSHCPLQSVIAAIGMLLLRDRLAAAFENGGGAFYGTEFAGWKTVLLSEGGDEILQVRESALFGDHPDRKF